MNRKLLNDIRRVMFKKGFLNASRYMDGELSKPIRPNIKYHRSQSRFDRSLSEKHYVNNLKKINK